MTQTQNIDLSYAESQTYFCLGIIAANAGWREAAYKGREKALSEQISPNQTVNLGGWILREGFNGEELEELYKFRNSLFHGRPLVKSDGSMEIHDDKLGLRTYTVKQINEYAARFYNVRIDRRVEMSFSVQSVCKCGAKFPEPEGHKDLLEHTKGCSTFNGESSI